MNYVKNKSYHIVEKRLIQRGLDEYDVTILGSGMNFYCSYISYCKMSTMWDKRINRHKFIFNDGTLQLNKQNNLSFKCF